MMMMMMMMMFWYDVAHSLFWHRFDTIGGGRDVLVGGRRGHRCAVKGLEGVAAAPPPLQLASHRTVVEPAPQDDDDDDDDD
eukprot:CAMPEP_0198204448 /NCGR_PEP_ID=MMETSP1445-20131203/7859_1 /TAXON_ID=36898 /ORGANISM="Pyramimonas sp., Strain CCMP2087" /LENGTH=80 /DNA_ID=CAMNT_0043876337 /DNA_START=442 /DNA_END=681 /DNA_ORIENTATION=-